MDIVELADEVLQGSGRQLLDDAVFDQFDKHIILCQVFHVFGTGQLVGLLLLFLSLLLFLLALALFLFAAGKLQFQVFELHLDHLIDVFTFVLILLLRSMMENVLY